MIAEKIYKIQKELESRAENWRDSITREIRDNLIKNRVSAVFPNANFDNKSSNDIQIQTLYKLFQKVSKLDLFEVFSRNILYSDYSFFPVVPYSYPNSTLKFSKLHFSSNCLVSNQPFIDLNFKGRRAHVFESQKPWRILSNDVQRLLNHLINPKAPSSQKKFRNWSSPLEFPTKITIRVNKYVLSIWRVCFRWCGLFQFYKSRIYESYINQVAYRGIFFLVCIVLTLQ